MTFSLHELLERQVKLMVHALGNDGKGNIHPLIVGEVERSLIQTVLGETKYNHLLTAKMLGISRSTLYRKITSLGIVIKRGMTKLPIPEMNLQSKPLDGAHSHQEEPL